MSHVSITFYFLRESEQTIAEKRVLLTIRLVQRDQGIAEQVDPNRLTDGRHNPKKKTKKKQNRRAATNVLNQFRTNVD